MQYKAKKPIDTPKANICVDVRALAHYLCNMKYVGKHKNDFNADTYIKQYKQKYCRKSP